MSQARIQKLPPEAIGKLQSCIVITDAVQCVLELVYNSLDAKATSIVVRIDLSNYKIQVIDNGHGISKADLTKIGEKFMTSKYDSYVKFDKFTTYGFKGQALPSLLDVCKTLTIQTKTQMEETVSVKVFENKIPLPVVKKFKNMEPGTTVTVEDFMSSMPVRRMRINEIFDVEEIKNQLKYLSIIHYNVSFTLRSDSKNFVVFQTQGSLNILTSVKNVFGESLSKVLRRVRQRHKVYKISGLICKRFLISNNIQLVYVNKSLITKGMIHKVVVDIMNKYAKKSQSISSNLSSQDSFYDIKKSKSMLHRAFILEITCPKSSCELFTNMGKCTVEFKAWKDVLKVIQKGIKEVFCHDENITISSQQCNKGEGQLKTNKEKEKHGTSLLVNVIKGKPVKRPLNVKHTSKNTEGVLVQVQQRVSNLPIVGNEIGQEFNTPAHLRRHKLCQEVNTKRFVPNQTVDSLESPIPKKKLRTIMKNDLTERAKLNVNKGIAMDMNQSFFQFYEWLKTKLEKDSDAFKFYHSYLHFKERKNSIIQNARDDSSKKEIFNVYKGSFNVLTKDAKSVTTNLLVSQHTNVFSQMKKNNEEYNISKVYQECYTNSSLKNMSCFWEGVFFNGEHNKNISFTNTAHFLPSPSQLFARPKNIEKASRHRSAEQVIPSLDETYDMFLNYVNFRNFSDDIAVQPNPSHEKLYLNTTHLSTWTSHIHRPKMDYTTHDLCAINNREGEYFKGCEKRKNQDIDSVFHAQEVQSCRNQNFQDNTLNSPARKSIGVQYYSVEESGRCNIIQRDAMIQTDTDVHVASKFTNPENIEPMELTGDCVSPSLLNLKHTNEEINMETCVNQEVPYPDFWNCEEENFSVQNKSFASTTSIENSTKLDQFSCNQNIEVEVNNAIAGSCSNEITTGVCTEALNILENSMEVTDRTLLVPEPNSTETYPSICRENINMSSLQIDTPKFHLTSRLDCMPKGLSPMVSNTESIVMKKLSLSEKSEIQMTVESAENDFLGCVKWQDSSFVGSANPVIPKGILDEMRRKAEKNMINNENCIPSASLSYCGIKVHNLLHSFAFTKDLLSGVEIIGQLDKKFIVARMKVPVPKKRELITLFDQHAVDERIKLEKIINENVLNDGKILSTCLNTPIECELNDSSGQILSGLNDTFLNFGLSFKLITDNKILIERIPTFVAEKYEKDIEDENYTLIKSFIRGLIVDATDELTGTRGALSSIPKILYNLFCSEACHSAVRFNRALTMKDMSSMVDNLKNCKLPFQCAHGRPSIIPIIDLEDFNSWVTVDTDEINHRKLMSFISSKKEDE